MFYEPEKNDHGLKRPPFKSIIVPRPIAWISTISRDGVPNLAPFSQFSNLGFEPPYIMLTINQHGKKKDTVKNIEETGEFVHNMVPLELAEKMNVTGGTFPPDVDEFELAGLTKAPARLVRPYLVAESPVQLECRYVQTVHLPAGGANAIDLIIGLVVGVHVKDEFIRPEDGKLDIERIRPLARMGYSDYAAVDRVFEMKAYSAAQGAGNALEGVTGVYK